MSLPGWTEAQVVRSLLERLRTYALWAEEVPTGDVPPSAQIEPVNLDALPENADWAKRTWDLGIDNVDDLRQFLAAIGETVVEFKRLPVYRWNVDKPELAWLKDLWSRSATPTA